MAASVYKRLAFPAQLTLPSISSNNSELSCCYENRLNWKAASWNDNFSHFTQWKRRKFVLHQDLENMAGVLCNSVTENTAAVSHFLNQSKIKIFSFHFWGKAAGKIDLFCQRTVVAQPLMSTCHYTSAFKYWSLTSSGFKCNNNRKNPKTN